MKADQRWWHTVIDSIGQDWKYAYAKPECHRARCDCGRRPAIKEGGPLPAILQGSIAPARVDPSVDMLRAAVKSVLPDVKLRAVARERARTVPVATVEALRQAGLYKLVHPAAYGGYEQDFTVLVALMMELAAACASTAWVFGLLAAHQWMVGLFPAQAQEDAWGTSPDATFCGSYAPINEARPERDGYRPNGRWSFASGCDNSQWAICAAHLPGTSDRPSRQAFLIAEKDRPLADKMLNGELGRQKRLKAELAQDPRASGWLDERKLFQNYKQLQFLDTLALYFNRIHPSERGEQNFENVPMNARQDVTITIRPVGTNVYSLSPFPFAASGAEHAFAGRHIEPNLGSSAGGWPEALKRSPTVWERFQLMAG